MSNEKEYSRETEWRTYDGRRVKIKNMTDDHLKNCINHIQKNQAHYSERLLWTMLKEATDRNLTGEFIFSPEIPFKDKKGNLVKWDAKNNRVINVGTTKTE